VQERGRRPDQTVHLLTQAKSCLFTNFSSLRITLEVQLEVAVHKLVLFNEAVP
jgi:hypothetical protein